MKIVDMKSFVYCYLCNENLTGLGVEIEITGIGGNNDWDMCLCICKDCVNKAKEMLDAET